MTRAVEAVLAEARDGGVETVRVSFVDQHGILRGKVIVVEDLPSVMMDGVAITSTLLLKDTSHTTVFPVWGDNAGFGNGVMTGASDLVMLPDPTTFRVLPWSPRSGWVLCDLYFPNGAPVPLSTRQVLQQGVSQLLDAGMEMVCGLEVEFAVYRVTSPNLAHHQAGRPGQPPETALLSQGYQYLTEQHYDRLEDVMDLLRRHAAALRMPVGPWRPEFGPSQFEMTFHPADPVTAADNMALFRSMVKQVCEREGLHATFMCRPGVPNAMGNGWHLHQSLTDSASGHNLFVPGKDEALSPVAAKWLAGLLVHAGESCLLTTPTINGYKRYQPFALAPDRVQWGRDNRGAMIRSLCAYRTVHHAWKIGLVSRRPILTCTSLRNSTAGWTGCGGGCNRHRRLKRPMTGYGAAALGPGRGIADGLQTARSGGTSWVLNSLITMPR